MHTLREGRFARSCETELLQCSPDQSCELFTAIVVAHLPTLQANGAELQLQVLLQMAPQLFEAGKARQLGAYHLPSLRQCWVRVAAQRPASHKYYQYA